MDFQLDTKLYKVNGLKSTDSPWAQQQADGAGRYDKQFLNHGDGKHRFYMNLLKSVTHCKKSSLMSLKEQLLTQYVPGKQPMTEKKNRKVGLCLSLRNRYCQLLQLHLPVEVHTQHFTTLDFM